MQFKAILFDLDGTLVDSLEDLADAMNVVLERSGFPLHPVDAYKAFIGDGIERLVQRALPEGRRSAASSAPFVQAMKTEYARRWTNKTRPYEGVPELLDGCVAAGLKTAIVTNKPDGPTRELVARLLHRWPFDRVCGMLPERPAKPDPTVALETARQLGVAPRRCIFLGDMAVDMQTAVSAGMCPVGARWGFRSAEELFSAGAAVVVRRPADLLPWVRNDGAA